MVSRKRPFAHGTRALAVMGAAWSLGAFAAVEAIAQGVSYMGIDTNVETGGPTIEGGIRVHVVEQGDTLWSLSELYLGDALAWPKLWALNPHVTNPHWIFPGDKIYLDAATAAQAGSGPTGIRQVDGIYSRGAKAQRPRLTRTVGFIADQDYRPTGTIQHSREPKEHLATHDEVYLDLDESATVELGQRLTIYRDDRELRHPKTDDRIGHLVKYLGTLRIIDTSAKLKKAVIEDAVEEIVRGDHVTAYFQQLHRVAPRKNEGDLDALVVASFRELDMYAQDLYVFIDKGAVDGVHIGNQFELRERGDSYLMMDDRQETDMEDFPWEVAGEAMVVEVYENHCLAIITASIHEFEAGQLAVMRQGR